MFAALAGVAAQTAADAARLRWRGARDGRRHRQPEVRRRGARHGAQTRRARCARASGRERPVWRRSVDARRRGGSAARRAGSAHRLPPLAADDDRAAASAALRRRRRRCSRRAASLRAPDRRPRRCRRAPRCCWATRWASWRRYYAAADVAFVGGSLLPLGGQNLIEPIAVGHADAGRSAHLQFRGGDQRAGGGAQARRCACRTPTRWSREVARAAATMPARRERDARRRRSPFTPRIAARPSVFGSGSTRGCPARSTGQRRLMSSRSASVERSRLRPSGAAPQADTGSRRWRDRDASRTRSAAR